MDPYWKSVIFLDNCFAKRSVESLLQYEIITVYFFLLIKTSKIQPLDEGMNNSSQVLYRTIQYRYVLKGIDVDLKDFDELRKHKDMRWMKYVWDKILSHSER